MSESPPSLDEFKAKVEILCGQSLTGPASEAVEDFWTHWSSFSSLIAERSLAVHVDALSLGMNFPQYKRYSACKGAGTVALLLGIVTVWFFWRLGAVLIAAGIGLYLWCGRLKVNDAKNLADELIKEATLNSADGGYARLCANYIAGTIQLVSPAASAHWPQFPSNAVTGEQSFIST
jgi:hypothetical protein